MNDGILYILGSHPDLLAVCAATGDRPAPRWTWVVAVLASGALVLATWCAS